MDPAADSIVLKGAHVMDPGQGIDRVGRGIHASTPCGWRIYSIKLQ